MLSQAFYVLSLKIILENIANRSRILPNKASFESTTNFQDPETERNAISMPKDGVTTGLSVNPVWAMEPPVHHPFRISPRMLLKFTALFLLVASMSGAADIQLTPSGPVSTPQAARDAARAAAKPVRIVVSEGTYSLTEALVLSPEDSQVIWEAAPGARPVFTGGRAIKGWKQAEGGLWTAEVPEAKAEKWPFIQLWINGRRAMLARTPNKGYFNIAEAAGASVFPGITTPEFHAFSLYPEHFAILKDIPADQRDAALITVTHAWAVGQCRIQALDEPTRSVQIKGRSRYPFVTFEPDQRYWLENFRSALDTPGEWFLDQTARVLYYHPLPREDMTKAEVIAPVADQFITIKGADDIAFKGLSFQHSQYVYPKEGLHDGQAAATVGASIELENSTGIRFENCEVAHTGTHAIYFKNGCSNSTVLHCHLKDLGGGGVRIAEVSRPEEDRLCHDITVEDCIIQHCGRLHPSACGVLITHARNCAVIHCDIGDLYYTGVSIGWNWGYGESMGRENRVENNHIHHLGWAYLSDMGGFYGLGNAPGTVIRGNHVHHIVSHRYGGWGLYTDEGSGDVLMENNLVHDTSESGFHQHYGYANRIKNNIFAFGKKAQIQRSRNEGRLTFTYERNIVMWDPASPLLDGGEWNWKPLEKVERGDPKDSVIFRKNLYWPTDGKIPALLTNSTFTWDEWRKLGRDNGSLFADPLFENVAKRDFRLKANSPVSKIGFKPWDLALAGVRADGADSKAWRALAAQGHEYPTWAADAQPWPAPPYQIPMQTFESAAMGSLGIRGGKWDAQGKGDSIGVSDEAASPIPVKGEGGSKRSLKVQDAPDLAHSYDPVLDVFPQWEEGTFRVSFDIMAQPGADWFFEQRVKGGEFAAGPYLRWQKGHLVANNTGSTKLAEIPANEWVRIAITATTGSGKWAVMLTRQDGSIQEFKDLPCKPSWNAGSYLLWSALGTTKTAYFIDNLSLTKL